jgi:hypothetical protein
VLDAAPPRPVVEASTDALAVLKRRAPDDGHREVCRGDHRSHSRSTCQPHLNGCSILLSSSEAHNRPLSHLIRKFNAMTGWMWCAGFRFSWPE